MMCVTITGIFLWVFGRVSVAAMAPNRVQRRLAWMQEQDRKAAEDA